MEIATQHKCQRKIDEKTMSQRVFGKNEWGGTRKWRKQATETLRDKDWRRTECSLIKLDEQKYKVYVKVRRLCVIRPNCGRGRVSQVERDDVARKGRKRKRRQNDLGWLKRQTELQSLFSRLARASKQIPDESENKRFIRKSNDKGSNKYQKWW